MKQETGVCPRSGNRGLSPIVPEANLAAGKNPDNPIYTPQGDRSSSDFGRQPPNTFGNNVTGFNETGHFCSQGTTCSKMLNQIPFINAIAGFHDYIFNANWLDTNPITNVGTMLPAAALAIPASMNNPALNWQLAPPKDEENR